jgi:poly-gamma-glutamate synthesis protein (capsule biosynthesis protein)
MLCASRAWLALAGLAATTCTKEGPVDVLPPLAAPIVAPLPSVWIRAVGDIMLARGIERQWRGDAGLRSLFAPVRSLLRAPDITFGNLESVAASASRCQDRGILLRSHPNALYALADAGFDVVSLANNHAEDCGYKALADTAAHLRELGIEPVGAPGPGWQRPGPLFLTRGGLRVAFLAYSLFKPSLMRLDEDAEGISIVSAQVYAADRAADLVVVSFHWGVEYQAKPTERQRRLGHLAVDAGADLVLGHHPHRVQGIEVYQGVVIAYSLGNFLFDQPWMHTRTTVLLDFWASTDGRQQVDIFPLRIERLPYAPRRLYGSSAHTLLARMREESAALGTTSEILGDRLRILGTGRTPPGPPVAEAGGDH